jgi:transglycosylase-like protein with SLT domain
VILPRSFSAALCLGLLAGTLAASDPAPAAPIASAEMALPRSAGDVAAAACGIVESAAQSSHVPVGLLTRLVWTESRFRADAISPAGAQGIAQFMPGTAAARGLRNPFDPEQAIPKAASLLAELNQQFGNIGLAAAAYNAGSVRVAGWLDGAGTLPAETRAYVLDVTGRNVDDWATDGRQADETSGSVGGESCLMVTAELRREDSVREPPIAPWGVQLAGNFSKAVALAAFERAQQRYAGFLGNLQPMVIGTVLRSRGTRRFYRVLVPAESRIAADQVCNAILAKGGACVALRS